MSNIKPGHPVEDSPELVWVNEHGLACCRFCGSAHEGTIGYTLEHWRKCTGIIAYCNALAENIDTSTALRLGARCYIHREGAADEKTVRPIEPAIEAILAVPSKWAKL